MKTRGKAQYENGYHFRENYWFLMRLIIAVFTTLRTVWLTLHTGKYYALYAILHP